MSDFQSLADKMVKSGSITRRELADKRKVLIAKGIPPHEVEKRVEQSLVALAGPIRALKDSRKTENFRPNYQGMLKKRELQVSHNPSKVVVPPELVAWQIQQKRLNEQRDRANSEKKALISAFRTHPAEAEKLRSMVLGKTEEERAKKKMMKKERRELARNVTGSKEGDWWQPIVDFGADMIPKLLPLLLGLGDYSDGAEIPLKKGSVPESNSLLAASTSGRSGYEPPFMHRRGGATRVAHREYVGDVYSSVDAFTATKFAINPGMEELFPWLAPLANQYTDYRLMGAVADFVSQGSDYANVAGLGYVALATQYNALAPDFQDKRELLNYEFADSVKPSVNMTHWIECKPGEIQDDEKTVRAGSIPTNADLRMYDHGSLFLVVGGNTAPGSIIGQLWISYDIEFYFPKISASLAGVLNYYQETRSSISAANPLGTTSVEVSSRSSISITTNSANVFWPANLRGDFLVVFVWTGTISPAAGKPGITSIPTGGLSIFGPIGYGAGVSGYNYYTTLYVRVIADGGGLIFDGLGTCLPIDPNSAMQIIVSQVPRSAPDPLEIFDPRGKDSACRYSRFMKEVLRERSLAVELDHTKQIVEAVKSNKAGNALISQRDLRESVLRTEVDSQQSYYVFKCIGDDEYYVFKSIDDLRSYFSTGADSRLDELINSYSTMTRDLFISSCKHALTREYWDRDCVGVVSPPVSTLCPGQFSTVRSVNLYSLENAKHSWRIADSSLDELQFTTLDPGTPSVSDFLMTYPGMSSSDFQLRCISMIGLFGVDGYGTEGFRVVRECRGFSLRMHYPLARDIWDICSNTECVKFTRVSDPYRKTFVDSYFRMTDDEFVSSAGHALTLKSDHRVLTGDERVRRAKLVSNSGSS